MKALITLILPILFFSYTHAQAPAIEWQKSFGGSSSDYGQAIKATPDGGYIAVGRSESTNGDVTGNHGNRDYWVVKLDAMGVIQWQKSLGGASGDDLAYDVENTTDGGYVIAGYTFANDGDVSGNHGNTDCWIVKLNAAGTIQWQKTLGGSGYDEAYAIKATPDGGYIVAGNNRSNDGDVSGNHGSYDYWIVKLDSTGAIMWQKSLGGTGADYARAIENTLDGGYIVAGYTSSNNGDVTGNHGEQDYWIVKLDGNGTMVWQKTLGGTSSDFAYAVQATADGGYVVAGGSSSTNGDITGNHGGQDFWIVKLDANGTILWQKSIGGTSNDFAFSIKTTIDGGFIVAGESTSSDGDVVGNQGGTDYLIVKLDALGTIQWQKTMGGNNNDVPSDIQVTADNGYVIVGYSSSNSGDVTGNHGYQDYWVVKLAPDALGTSTFTKDRIVIYPNPVRSILNIQTATLAQISKVKIIDIQGKIILEQTQNTNTINVENLAKGLYILQAYLGDHMHVSKFIKE